MTPRKATKEKQLLSLKRDNVNYKDHWMLVSEGSVFIANQKSGESPTGIVEIPKRIFNRMVKFYLAEQK